MLITIRRKHLKMGQPRHNKCPLALACQEAFDLEARCMEVTPKVLMMMNYHGAFTYSVKWPPIAEQFYQQYYDHFKLGSKFAKHPKPCEFDLGLYEYYPDYVVDILHKAVFDIHNWFGDLSYD